VAHETRAGPGRRQSPGAGERRRRKGDSLHIGPALEERATGLPLCVVDTIYKAPEAPATSDVSQVVTYALSKGCSEAVLAYPTMPAKPFDDVIGEPGIRLGLWSSDWMGRSRLLVAPFCRHFRLAANDWTHETAVLGHILAW